MFSWLQHCSFNVATSIVIDFLIKKLKICYYYCNETVLRNSIYTMYHGSTKKISNYTIHTVGVIQWAQKCIHIKTFLYQNELLSSLMLMQYIQLIQKSISRLSLSWNVDCVLKKHVDWIDIINHNILNERICLTIARARLLHIYVFSSGILSHVLVTDCLVSRNSMVSKYVFKYI